MTEGKGFRTEPCRNPLPFLWMGIMCLDRRCGCLCVLLEDESLNRIYNEETFVYGHFAGL